MEEGRGSGSGEQELGIGTRKEIKSRICHDKREDMDTDRTHQQNEIKRNALEIALQQQTKHRNQHNNPFERKLYGKCIGLKRSRAAYILVLFGLVIFVVDDFFGYCGY